MHLFIKNKNKITIKRKTYIHTSVICALLHLHPVHVYLSFGDYFYLYLINKMQMAYAFVY